MKNAFCKGNVENKEHNFYKKGISLKLFFGEKVR